MASLRTKKNLYLIFPDYGQSLSAFSTQVHKYHFFWPNYAIISLIYDMSITLREAITKKMQTLSSFFDPPSKWLGGGAVLEPVCPYQGVGGQALGGGVKK